MEVSIPPEDTDLRVSQRASCDAHTRTLLFALQDAYQDFKKRTAEYEKIYETMDLTNPDDKHHSFVQYVTGTGRGPGAEDRTGQASGPPEAHRVVQCGVGCVADLKTPLPLRPRIFPLSNAILLKRRERVWGQCSGQTRSIFLWSFFAHVKVLPGS